MKLRQKSLLWLLWLLPATAWATAAAGRFTVDASGVTVTDGLTKLTWQRTVTSALTLADATTYCAALPAAGGGWRVPNVRELRSVFDRAGPGAIDATAFPSAPAEVFWTSTPVAGQTTVWAIQFAGAGSLPRAPTLTARVRCVR